MKINHMSEYIIFSQLIVPSQPWLMAKFLQSVNREYLFSNGFVPLMDSAS